ncbi:ferredoxin family protein [Streptomyces sp. NBC_01275]|uniref:4Fe-4S dicluster domain-containing protein n=1 Tax=Streptomyces sp. NBC_01275 TaxID=2903807 RepID=UPI00225295A9|nr:ferredoxin family protein [Streptomyces sp. NBC_01275]MCX4763962.1 ferredoxin family protein [Streptomyces sp. NBC_01275]
MTYVITDACVGVKEASCVAVCPVDCIGPLPGSPEFDSAEQLYINPAECIDCQSCAVACPVDACYPEDELPPEWSGAQQSNADYFAQGITSRPS